MQIKGVLKAVMEVEEFQSGFKKRGFVVETQEQYPQTIYFELFKGKVQAIQEHKKIS